MPSRNEVNRKNRARAVKDWGGNTAPEPTFSKIALLSELVTHKVHCPCGTEFETPAKRQRLCAACRKAKFVVHLATAGAWRTACGTKVESAMRPTTEKWEEVTCARCITSRKSTA